MNGPLPLLLSFLVLASPGLLWAIDVTLLPLGDSITENPHWRYPLWQMFLDDGHAINMVGTRSKGGPPDYRGLAFDADHEGYWGISAEWLFRKADGLSLSKRLEQIKQENDDRLVDIVAYHIGTNDINTNDRAHGERMSIRPRCASSSKPSMPSAPTTPTSSSCSAESSPSGTTRRFV